MQQKKSCRKHTKRGRRQQQRRWQTDGMAIATKGMRIMWLQPWLLLLLPKNGMTTTMMLCACWLSHHLPLLPKDKAEWCYAAIQLCKVKFIKIWLFFMHFISVHLNNMQFCQKCNFVCLFCTQRCNAALLIEKRCCLSKNVETFPGGRGTTSCRQTHTHTASKQTNIWSYEFFDRWLDERIQFEKRTKKIVFVFPLNEA